MLVAAILATAKGYDNPLLSPSARNNDTPDN